MNKVVKYSLIGAGAYLVYRLYSLYELGNKVTYDVVGVSFVRGKTLKDFTIKVKMKLNNTTPTTLKMKSVEGKLLADNQEISTFQSSPFTINSGINYFTLDFKLNYSNAASTFIASLISKTKPILKMEIKKKLPLFTISESFILNETK